MLKILAISGTFVVLAGVMSSQPNKAATGERHSTKQGQPAVVQSDSQDKRPASETYQTEPYSNSPSGNTTIERSRWWQDSSWWLVIIAGFTGLFIGWQAWETRKTSEAALKQGEYMASAERAWLVIRSSMKDYAPTSSDNFEYWWSIQNTGDTPARIVETQCMYEFVQDVELYNLPPIPKYPEPIELRGLLVPPGGIEEFNTGLRFATDGRWLKRGDLGPDPNTLLMFKHLRVYGYVKYMDAFGSMRESRFCEYYVPRASERSLRSSGFRPLIGAPSEYTECT